ncbi:phospho-sugar mutase [Irregularibacter muris]|uniref:Phosphoglucomutase n=1 Tax=Irregularibacter muris TaxID=1796619 RepID=A0AAE3HDT5_9FIRM|nr:phospho-sugar mutase [Irregularibacter muris]MCR1898286.1 phospho-sugar mutase [Irregularibacter muris]
MGYMDKYNQWMESENIDEATKDELEGIKDDLAEIEDRFYKDLEFGTGGLRGLIGAGTNRMNKYTVGVATQSLANYINSLGKVKKYDGVAIAYDSRNFSPDFAQEAALVLNGNGIKTYLFDGLRSTPELSFAVRHLGCAGGIVVTASHNPPQYNGYKVYSPEGGQLVPEQAKKVIEEVKKVGDFSNIKSIDKDEAVRLGLFNVIGKEVDDVFIETIKTQSLRQEVIQKLAADFKMVYTPLHGTGNIPVQRILKEVGFKNVYVVEEQAKPDGNFPTVEYPNPEEEKAYTLALELAEKENAHLIIATDPDSDRVGVVFRNKKGEYLLLSGNQIGALLTNYIITSQKEKGILPSNGAIIKTIVTSEMGADIAKSFDIQVYDTLTGFKFIGEKMEEFLNTGKNTFIFGYEESYGYLVGNHARDKDAVVSSMLIAEMAAYYYSQDKTLEEILNELYEIYGYFYEDLKSITLEGKAGMEKINDILSYFRKNCPMIWNGKKVCYVEDYLAQKQYNHERNVVKLLGLPKSNVLKFILEDGSWFCMRPSGTEPKIKFYFSTKGESMNAAEKAAHHLMAEVMTVVEGL